MLLDEDFFANRAGPHLRNLIRKLGRYPGVFRPFRGGYPPQNDPVGLHSQFFEDGFQQDIAAAGIKIALLIMAIAGMAAHHHNAVRAFEEGFGYEERIDPSGAHDSDDPDRRRYLLTADSRQVGTGV